MSRAARHAAWLLLALASVGVAAEPPANHRNFVSCPIVRDTPTVPCWLAEYHGELYYLGIQTDVSAEFHPPLLGHQVLVEGTIKDGPRICGGIVLEPIKISPMPELDGTCNTILPAEDQYTVPFAPRPPGPSGGRLAFDPPPGAARQAPAPPTGAQEFVLYYDFDVLVGGRHSSVLSRIYDYASSLPNSKIAITCHRGAILLSDGSLLTEREDLALLRAQEVAKLLHGAGLPADAMRVEGSAELAPAKGDHDWQQRRCTVRVEP
jgi:outer membrane protein OmpA-like peptidoglycan-associated protein